MIMKLSSSLLGITAAAVIGIPNNVNAQQVYPCPAAGTSSILPVTSNTNTTSLIRLPIITNPNGLCILLRHSKVDGTKRVHVVRSYAGNAWELSAGSFTKRDSGVAIDCNVGDVYECEVTLPPLAVDDTEEYVLESYEYQISPEAEASRFLEQVRVFLYCIVIYIILLQQLMFELYPFPIPYCLTLSWFTIGNIRSNT